MVTVAGRFQSVIALIELPHQPRRTSSRCRKHPPHTRRLAIRCLHFLVRHVVEFSLQRDPSDTSCAQAEVAAARVWLEPVGGGSDSSVAASYVVAYDQCFFCPVSPQTGSHLHLSCSHPSPPSPRSSCFPSVTLPPASRYPTRIVCNSSVAMQRQYRSACVAAPACATTSPALHRAAPRRVT